MSDQKLPLTIYLIKPDRVATFENEISAQSTFELEAPLDGTSSPFLQVAVTYLFFPPLPRAFSTAHRMSAILLPPGKTNRRPPTGPSLDN
jgi:hypothetical protein